MEKTAVNLRQLITDELLTSARPALLDQLGEVGQPHPGFSDAADEVVSYQAVIAALYHADLDGALDQASLATAYRLIGALGVLADHMSASAGYRRGLGRSLNLAFGEATGALERRREVTPLPPSMLVPVTFHGEDDDRL